MSTPSITSVAHAPPPHAASAAAASSSAQAAQPAPSSAPSHGFDEPPDAPDDADDFDAQLELEQAMMQEAEQAAAAEEADGAGGFEADEGGGFFTDEQAQAAAAGTGGPNGSVDSLEEDAPARCFASGCRECGSVGVQQNFLTAFNVSVCYRCQRAHPARYALVTQTSCVHTYLLPVAMVQSRLGYIEKKNPHKQAWGSMKLYWKQQVLALVREKYGSVEALEAAKHARDVARVAKDDAKRRNAHRAAAREAAFQSTLAASMGDMEAQTPSEVVAMLAQRTRGMGGPQGAPRNDKRRRSRANTKGAASGEAAEEVEVDEHDPLEGLSAVQRKRAKQQDAARAKQVKQLHVHSFKEEEGRRRCKECGFVEEFEEF